MTTLTTNTLLLQEMQQHSNRLIRIKDVLNLTGLSRSYVYQLCKEGLFPKSLTLIPGGISVAWVEQEILEWIDQRISERDGV